MSDKDARAAPAYNLDAQVGFLLRRATQRHLAIFATHIPSLTPTQFATVAKLAELGPTSQNALGRATAMDAATIKGVVDRLREKGLLATTPEEGDRRMVIVALTAEGEALFADLSAAALRISAETLGPLSTQDQADLLRVLRALG